MNNKYTQPVLFFGITGGIFTFLYFMIVYWSGGNPFYGFFQKLILVPKALIITGSLYYIFAKVNNKKLFFGEGIVTGFFINLIMVFVSSIFIYLVIEYADTGMVDKQKSTLNKYMLTHKKQLIKESSEKTFKMNLENIKTINSYSLTLDRFFKRNIFDLPFVFFVSMVFSFITKLKRR